MAEELNSKQQDSIKLFEYDTWEKNGGEKAREYGIMAVPSIFVSGKAIPQKILIDGAPSREELLDAIEMANGRKKLEKQEGFLEKMLG